MEKLDDCIIPEILYLLSKGIELRDILNVIEIRYNKKIHFDVLWLNTYCKNKFGKSLDHLIRRENRFVYELHIQCAEERKKYLSSFIEKLDNSSIDFLRFVVNNLPWRVKNFPLIEMIVGSYRACGGKLIEKESALKTLVRVGFLLKIIIDDEELDQWLEIDETDFLALIRLINGAFKNQTLMKVGLDLDDLDITFLDLLLRLSKPVYIFPKTIVDDIYFANFARKPQGEIPHITWFDERYYHLCPSVIDQIKEISLERKILEVRKIASKLGINSRKLKVSDEGFFLFRTKDLNIVVSPWMFFSEKSVFTRNLYEIELLEREDNLLVILSNQKLSKFIKVLELSNKSNLAVLSLATDPPEIYYLSNASDVFRSKVNEFLRKNNFVGRDVTCELLREVFPLRTNDLIEYASKKFTIEGLTLLLDLHGYLEKDIDDANHMVKKALELYSFEEIARRIGYPGISEDVCGKEQ